MHENSLIKSTFSRDRHKLQLSKLYLCCQTVLFGVAGFMPKDADVCRELMIQRLNSRGDRPSASTRTEAGEKRHKSTSEGTQLRAQETTCGLPC